MSTASQASEKCTAKQKRHNYTIEHKILVARGYEFGVPGKGTHALAKKYGVARSTAKGWIRQLPQLEDTPKQRKRRRLGGGGRAQLPELERDLVDWIAEQNRLGLRVQDRSIQNKAKKLYEDGGYTQNFAFSSGWLHNFKKRHNLVSRRATTTRVLPDDAFQTCWQWILETRNLIRQKGILSRNILNLDQVPRYLQTEGSQTTTLKGTRSVLLRHASSSQRRCTVTFMIAADGSFYPPHILFSKLKRKPTLADGVLCDVNGSGMWSGAILDSYIKEVVLSRSETALDAEPTLLLIDSYSPHVKLAAEGRLEAQNVFVKVIPPNMTNLLQPLDVAVNRSFQAHYARCFDTYMEKALSDVCQQTRRGNIKTPSCKQVSEWVKEWREGVDPSMVKRAFEVCGLGGGGLKITDLNGPLRQLLSIEAGDGTEFDQNVFLDDEDAYEFEEGRNNATGVSIDA